MLVLTQRPAARDLGGPRCRDGFDSGQWPQRDLALSVRSHGDVNRRFEVAMFHDHANRTICTRLSRLAKQLQNVIRPDSQQMQIFNRLGPVDTVELKITTDRQIDFLVLTQALHLGRQVEPDRRQPVGDLKLIHRFPILKQLEIIDLFSDRNSIQVGRGNDQSHILQHRQRDRRAVQVQPRAHEDLSSLARHQGLAIHIDTGLQLIGLGSVLKCVK